MSKYLAYNTKLYKKKGCLINWGGLYSCVYWTLFVCRRIFIFPCNKKMKVMFRRGFIYFFNEIYWWRISYGHPWILRVVFFFRTLVKQILHAFLNFFWFFSRVVLNIKSFSTNLLLFELLVIVIEPLNYIPVIIN